MVGVREEGYPSYDPVMNEKRIIKAVVVAARSFSDCSRKEMRSFGSNCLFVSGLTQKAG